MVQSEVQIFIIWSKARYKQEEILKDMDKKFNILNIFEIEWSKEKFSNNLTRFYGQKLPKNSGKEKHCGNGKFLLVIVEDTNPKYEDRMTSRGELEKVNINMFDSKKKYREMTGGGHKIHGTDSELETKHNISLLLGITLENYLEKKEFSKEIKIINRDLTGSNGWSSLKELFEVLNETINYLVLRNYESYPDEFDFSIHGDIDILVDNYQEAQYILNGRKKYNKKFRVAYEVLIDGELIDFDLRYKGDDYYCKGMEEEMLESKVLYKGFYTPEKELHFNSLAYHAFVHKPLVADDYKEKLIRLYNEIFKDKLQTYEEIKIIGKVMEFLEKRDYKITEPEDLSVYLNGSFFSYNLMSNRRKFIEKKQLIKNKIKSIIKR